MSTSQKPEYETIQHDPDDLSLDESLIHLCRILLPKLTFILFTSVTIGILVGLYIYIQPRAYVCTTIISPGGVRDTIDLVQYQITDESTLMDTSTVKQVSQLKVLAESSQVKRALINEHDLMKKWECETELECIRALGNIYKVKEIRNVGLEVSATSEDEQFAFDLANSGIEQTNKYFENSIKSNAEKSIEKFTGLIENTTKEYKQVSANFIIFASSNNITDIEQQNKDALALLNTLQNSIVEKETELIQKSQGATERSYELLPLKESIKDLKKKIRMIQFGTSGNSLEDLKSDELNISIYFPTSQYQSLKIKYNDYQAKLNQLQNELDIFNKRLATVELEAESSLQSLMTLDEPVVQPAAKGTVKFTVLTMIGVFFMLCIFFIFMNYIGELKKQLQEQS